MTWHRRAMEVCADHAAAAVCGGAGDFVGSDVPIGHLPQMGCELFKADVPVSEAGIDPG